MITTFQKEQLTVKIFPDRKTMGQTAASEAGDRIRALLEVQPAVNIIFAAAPSQNEFLEALTARADLDWGRINAYHMDEYIGLDAAAPQGFGNFLKTRLFGRKPFRSVNYLNGQCVSKEAECDRYARLLAAHPADIVCMGIGENTHIAFNDPHVADFDDPALVKVVELDSQCRQQQVNDGCFNAIGEVPTHALTVTIPGLVKARYLFCMVPGPNKAQAVAHTLQSEVTARYPSTILRRHGAATLYLDADSAALLK